MAEVEDAVFILASLSGYAGRSGTQALIALTLGDEVGRAFFLSGSIATVVIGSLLFDIGYDKIRQKQFMEILRREAEQPRALQGAAALLRRAPKPLM